jgi:hypothetical protein
MLGLGIILAHLVGDYLFQTHWMAIEKTSRWLPAIIHGITYTIPYLFVTQSFWALFIICTTHIVIDRFRLARHFVWFKNQLAPKAHRPVKADLKTTGYPANTPPWLAVWLMIIADNTLHLLINTAAILLFI